MILRLLFLALVLFHNLSFSQTIQGTVKDAATGAPLPYVNIGVFNKNIGSISHDDGSFQIDVSNANEDDALTFSMMGYETKDISISEVKGDVDVRLTSRTFQLREVVFEDAKRKPVKVGRYTPTKQTTGHSGTRKFGLGGEWGLKIFNEGKKYWVDGIGFHTRFNHLDSILFRLRIYSIANDLPNENLLQKETFVKSYKKDKWIVKDISSENLIIDSDVIVTFEVVRLWFSDSGDNAIFFTHGEGYEKGGTYYRHVSHGEWTLNKRPPITMYLSVVEY